MALKNIYIKQTNYFSFCLQEICFSFNLYFCHVFKFQSGLPQYIMELSVKYTTLIFFVQVSVVLDSYTIQIYKGCQQKVSLIGHLRKKLLTIAMNFIAKDYSQLKTEKLADIQKQFLTCQSNHQNYHFLQKFTKK